MKRLLKYFSIFACLVLALSSCGDDVSDFDTRKNEYEIYYCITYSTVYDFHNIAYINYTTFYDLNDPHRYTNIARQEEHIIDGTSAYFFEKRVPKGSHIQLSTYVDVPDALPNTKAIIKIEVSKGDSNDFVEVASAEGDCPLKGNPLTISYDVPNK